MQAFLTILLLLAAIAIVVLLIRFYQLRSQMSDRAQQLFSDWRNRDTANLRSELWHAAQAESGANFERWKLESEANIRADAVRRSTSVVIGKVTEHLAPYISDFPYNPKDARFLGTPVDLIIFDGMCEDNLREIVFLEVKSASSTLTTRERRIRDAVIEKRIQWRELHVATPASRLLVHPRATDVV